MYYLAQAKTHIFKIISLGLCFAFILSTIFPQGAFAARSNAGGGELAEFDFGNLALSAGMSLGSMAIGSAINSGMLSGWSNFTQGTSFNILSVIGDSLWKSFNYSSMVAGYTNFVATSQVSRAIGMMGRYYEWDPGVTLVTSLAFTGATAGFLNPAASLGDAMSKTMSEIGISTMAKGAAVGAMGNLLGGATLIAIDGERISQRKGPGVAAQIAGMVSTVFGTSLGRTLVDPRTYDTALVQYTPVGHTSDTISIETEIPISVVDSSGKERPVVLGWERTGGGGYVSTKDLIHKTGVAGLYEKLESAGIILSENREKDILTADALRSASKIFNSPQTEYLGQFGDHRTFIINGEETGRTVMFNLSKEQVIMLENFRFGTEGTLWLPQGGTSDYTITKRILMGPLVDTFNQWPVMASNALNIAITNNMGESRWRPLVSTVVSSMATPIFDTFANVYSLKPSLFFDIEQSLGYYPKYKYAQQELFAKAREQRVAMNAAEAPINIDIRPELIEKRTEIDTKVSDINLKINQLIEESAQWGGVGEFDIMAERESLLGRKEQISELITRLDEKRGVFMPSTIDTKIGEINLWIQDAAKMGLPPSEIESLKAQKVALEVEKFNLTELVKNLNLSVEQQQVIIGQLKEVQKQKVAKIEDFTPYEAKKVLFYAIMGEIGKLKGKEQKEFLARQSGVFDQMPILEKIGGSRWEVFSSKLQDMARYELPVALISGGIQMGLNEIIDNKNPTQSMLASLSGIAATSIARGIVLHQYAKDLYDKQIESIKERKFRPELATSIIFKDPAEIILARIKGELPPPDPQRRIIVDIITWEGKEQILVPVGPDPESPKGYLKAEVTHIDLGKEGGDLIFVHKGKPILPGSPEHAQVTLQEGWKLEGNKISPFDKFFLNGEEVGAHPVAKVPDLSTTILGNLGQGFFEFGWKSLAMGLPYTQQGKLSEFGWYRYIQNLHSLASAAANIGFGNVMFNHSTNVAKEIISRNILTILDNRVELDMAKVVPITGYKRMPYSEAVIMDKGWSQGVTMFYPYWPYSEITPLPNDHFWSRLNQQMGREEPFITDLDIGKAIEERFKTIENR